MSSITLNNVEFTLDDDALIDSIDSMDSQARSFLLDRLVEKHPMGLTTRLVQFEANRIEFIRQASQFNSPAVNSMGFGPEKDDEEDDGSKLDEEIQRVLDENGFGQFVSDFDLENDAVEWAVDMREDEIVDALKANGTIPDVEIDDVKYNLREALRLLEEAASNLDC